MTEAPAPFKVPRHELRHAILIRRKVNEKIIALGLTGAFLLSPYAAFADVASELSTAQTHAGLAAKATSVATVHMHLHHALNCLVGPAGAGFDKTNENPCATAGMGAIPDGGAAMKTKLQTAVSSAKAGIASNNLATAQKDAQATSDAIAAAK